VPKAPLRIDLVIFDCDGVLIDSEPLSAAVLLEMAAELGLPITPEVFANDFLGRSFATASKRVKDKLGLHLPDQFNLDYRARLLARMKGNLREMPGVRAVLDNMKRPYCLATSSSPPRLQVSMGETGLGRYFAGRMFTASLVPNGKPAPDLLFHAAREMHVAPEHCLVIEDSEMGLRAGLAAGAEVWHFTGGGHFRDGFTLPQDVKPQRTLDSMAALHEAFRQIGIAD
jgi:HAD superfamily hydrolase (TIGR01509 family)